MKFDKPVILENSDNPSAAVIWLHGLGADGFDFGPIVAELNFACKDSVRFIFPHANSQPVTLAGGMPLRAWFDIYSLDKADIGREDVDGMNQTNQYIHSLIDEQIKQGIDSRKIILAGFSQGGAMAFYSALTYSKPLAGIMGLSTLLGGSKELAKNRHDANNNTMIWMAHGTEDDVVSYELGSMSREMLLEWGYPVEWTEYQIGHTLCPQEIKDIAHYLQRCFA